MIKEYSKFELNNLKVEANFGGEDVSDCKVIKLTIDDKVAFIDKHDLYALLVLYADQEEMTELVKVREKKVRMIRKAVKVTANKDLKKGEDVVFVIEYPVDADIHEKWMEDNKEFMTQEEALAELNK